MSAAGQLCVVTPRRVVEQTEIACAECGARKVFAGAPIAAMRRARTAGWGESAVQFPGRHTVWMTCPKENEGGSKC